MIASFSEADLSHLNSRIEGLQRSTRRTLPIFLIGVIATIVAAAVAVYYIVALSSDLASARITLRQSEARVARVQAQLSVANAALREAQVGASSAATAGGIARAIQDLSNSQRDLTIASASIQQAAAKLPNSPAADRAPVSWFAVAGSYPISAEGFEKAVAQHRKAEAAGLCAELWQTQVSRNYAVVIGARTDQSGALAAARQARQVGLAGDAFAQPDRNWTKLPQSPTC